MVSKYQQMESNMGPTGEVGSMKDNITDLQKQLAELRDAKKLQSQAYSKLMEARQKVRWAGFRDRIHFRIYEFVEHTFTQFTIWSVHCERMSVPLRRHDSIFTRAR